MIGILALVRSNHPVVFSKKCLKNSQNSHENTYARVFFKKRDSGTDDSLSIF